MDENVEKLKVTQPDDLEPINDGDIENISEVQNCTKSLKLTTSLLKS